MKKAKKITIFKLFKKLRNFNYLGIFCQFSIYKGIPYTKINGISFGKLKDISYILTLVLHVLWLRRHFKISCVKKSKKNTNFQFLSENLDQLIFGNFSSTFILTDGWDGMGWSVHFFFWRIS